MQNNCVCQEIYILPCITKDHMEYLFKTFHGLPSVNALEKLNGLIHDVFMSVNTKWMSMGVRLKLQKYYHFLCQTRNACARNTGIIYFA